MSEQGFDQPTHLDLFSGIGGFSIAAERVGFRTIAFCEKEPYCQQVLKEKFGAVPIFTDIKHLTAVSMFDVLRIWRTIEAAGTSKPQKCIESACPSGNLLNSTESPDKECGTSSSEGEYLFGLKKETVRKIISLEEHGHLIMPRTPWNMPSEKGSSSENHTARSVVRFVLSQMEGQQSKRTIATTTIPSKSCGSVSDATMNGTNTTKQSQDYDRSIQLVTAGFPCQPYSCAGKRAGSKDDRALWPQIVRLLQEMASIGELPAWCLFENVPGIINLELDNVLSDLEGQGYETGTLIIPACAVDARHRRDRVWIVAHAVMRGSQKRRAENDGSMAGCSGQRETTSNDISTAAEPSQDVAHTNQGGIRRPRAQGNEGHASFCGEDAADTQGVRFQGERPTREQEPAAHDGAGLPVCGREDVSNPSMRLNSGIGAQRNQRELENGDGESHQQPCLWCPEPELGRVAYGVPNRAHRLRALGNAIVPQVAEVILKAIYQQIIAEGTLTPSQSQTAPAASAPVRG